MSEPLTGVIADRQFLDLTALHTPEELAGITELTDIQIVAVPESLAATVARIPINDVQLIVPVLDGSRPRFHQGITKMGGDALAHAGTEKEVLIVLGALVFTSPIQERRISRIAVLGTILAPIGSEDALGAVVTEVLGTTHFYPYVEGQQITASAGQVKLGPGAIANESGTPDDILLAAGQVTVTGPISTVGFRQVIMAGQVMLPTESQEIFGSRLQTYGQTVWYQGEPRYLLGEDSYGRAFFELVERPLAFLVFGVLRIESDVPAELLRDKVSSIALFGQIFAPKHLIPVLQYRTTEQHGEIKAVEDESE